MSDFLQAWRDETQRALEKSPAAKDGRTADGVPTEKVIALALIQLCDCLAKANDQPPPVDTPVKK